jgi:molybdopterin synthase sulfur carrier subunit
MNLKVNDIFPRPIAKIKPWDVTHPSAPGMAGIWIMCRNFGIVKHTVKTFGIAREIMGGREVVVETTGMTVGELRAALMRAYPQLLDLRSLFIAVNLKYADDSARLSETDEIALIPPVSGG